MDNVCIPYNDKTVHILLCTLLLVVLVVVVIMVVVAVEVVVGFVVSTTITTTDTSVAEPKWHWEVKFHSPLSQMFFSLRAQTVTNLTIVLRFVHGLVCPSQWREAGGGGGAFAFFLECIEGIVKGNVTCTNQNPVLKFLSLALTASRSSYDLNSFKSGVSRHLQH